MTNPTDGRLTSLNTFSGALSATAIFEMVTPGNAATGVNYQITLQQFANAAFSTVQAGGGTVFGNPSTATSTMLATTAPVLGRAGTAAGTLGLASATAGGAIVTLGNPRGTTAYNFNLPTTAGTVGALELSGGGGTAPNTWQVIGNIVTAAATSGVSVTGSTAIVLDLATQTGLSVLGVAGTATAVPLAIVAAGANLLLQSNATGILFTSLGASLLPTGGTGLPFVANGTGNASSFQILTVPGGGTGTTTLTANAVLLGAGTTTLRFAAISTAGNLLIDQGAGTSPLFKTVAGDVTISANGTTTIGANKVQFAQIQTVTGLSIIGVASTVTGNVGAITGLGGQFLKVNTAGTGIAFSSLTNPQINVYSSTSTTLMSAVFTTPTGALYLTVEISGPGGSSAGSGTTAGAGTVGTTSFFGSVCTAFPGAPGTTTGNQAAAGGTASGGDFNIVGGISGIAIASPTQQGGQGGAGYFGGSGPVVLPGFSAGVAGQAPGAGASGASSGAAAGSGSGGGAGGYLNKIIGSPNATYAVQAGAPGALGVAGSSGAAGALGGQGMVIVRTYFQ